MSEHLLQLKKLRAWLARHPDRTAEEIYGKSGVKGGLSDLQAKGLAGWRRKGRGKHARIVWHAVPMGDAPLPPVRLATNQ